MLSQLSLPLPHPSALPYAQTHNPLSVALIDVAFNASSTSISPSLSHLSLLTTQRNAKEKRERQRKRMDAIDSVFDPLREFAKDSVSLVKHCHKPDRKGDINFIVVCCAKILYDGDL